MQWFLDLFQSILHGPVSYGFVYAALPASIFFLVLVGLSLFSDVLGDNADGAHGDFTTDHDASGIDHDHSSDHDHSTFVKFLTLKNIVYFVTFFSWTGIVALEHGASEGLALTIAIVAGVGLTIGLNALFLFLTRSEKVVSYELTKLIGKTGQAYLSMQPNEAGQIQIEMNGSLDTIHATNVGDKKINTGDRVEVVDVVDNKFLKVKSL